MVHVRAGYSGLEFCGAFGLPRQLLIRTLGRRVRIQAFGPLLRRRTLNPKSQTLRRFMCKGQEPLRGSDAVSQNVGLEKLWDIWAHIGCWEWGYGVAKGSAQARSGIGQRLQGTI